MTNTKSSREYRVLSAFMFSLFVSYSFVYAMYAIWLSQSTSLSGEKIGVIFAINSVAALCAQPLLGFVQDKLGSKQYLLWLNIVALLIAGPFFSFVYRPLLIDQFWVGAFIGAIYVSLVFLAMAAAVETYVERISRYNSLEYGKIRTWGSLGWASAAFFTGYLMNIHYELNFWMASGCAIVPLFILAFIKIPATEEPLGSSTDQVKLVFSDIADTLRSSEFLKLTLYVFGVSAMYVIYDQQFPVYFASVFPTTAEGNQMFGFLNSAQIYLEAAGFFLAPWLIVKIGPKRGLLLAGALMVFRIVGSGLTDHPVLISLIKLLHAAELPILIVAFFKYLNLHFDSRMSSSLFLIGFAVINQIGTILLSPIAGMGYDQLGFQTTYLIIGGIATCALLVSARLLSPDQGNLAETASPIDISHEYKE